MQLASRLSSPDERFRELADAVGVPFGPLTMKERLELTAELNALVARHYGLMRKFNGEVRQRVMKYFDAQGGISEKEAA